MAEIKLFLLSSMNENEHSINQFFPLDFHDEASSSEVLKIKKIFKKCGDGCLQTKDYKYFYKTFITLMNSEQNLFLIFYCTNSYSEKNIDKLCEELFIILDEEPIEDGEFKNTTKNEINQLFLKFKRLNNNNYENINISLFGTSQRVTKKNVMDFCDEKSDVSSIKKYKRGDPRFYSYFIRKPNSRNESSMFSDSNVFKTCSFEDDSGVSARKFNTDENIEKWRKVKKNYLIFSVILSIITYIFLPLLLRLLFN